MKKFLTALCLFLLLPAVVGVAWTVFVVVMDYRSYTQSLKMPAGTTIAVCGDSQTKDALDPSRIPGLFNFSTAATTCDQDLLRLSDLLVVNRGRLSYVLLDISPLKVGYSLERPVSELNAARVHALLHVYHLPVNRRALGSVGALWRDVVCTRKYNEFRKSILRGRPWRSSMAGAFGPDKAQGFLNPKYRDIALKDVVEKADRVNRRTAASIDLPIFDILAESVGLVRAAGAVPVVTTMPLAKALRTAFDADKLAAFREATRDVAVRLGVEQLDYLDLDLPDACWHDGNHLNRTGAAEFSVRFAEDLEQIRRRTSSQKPVHALSVVCAGEMRRPPTPADLGGLSWAGGETYWSVRDTGGELCELRIPVDAATGEIRGFALGRTFKVPRGKDLEGTAYDPLRKSVWLSDENGPAVFEFRPAEGALGQSVELPKELFGVRKNRGLEALEISPDGLEMWTCNENELPADEKASPGSSEFLRLTRFARRDAASVWHVAGQWAYRPESPGGLRIRGKSRNGVSSICVMPDGSVLVLEREKRHEGKAHYRIRIFLVDLVSATDVRGWTSLADADFIPVRKHLLYEADVGCAMYEGMSLGPTLADGAWSLLLVSDGDDEADERMLSLKVVH